MVQFKEHGQRHTPGLVKWNTTTKTAGSFGPQKEDETAVVHAGPMYTGTGARKTQCALPLSSAHYRLLVITYSIQRGERRWQRRELGTVQQAASRRVEAGVVVSTPTFSATSRY